ncbi:recombinase RecT [Massilia sp. ZL223]|uniref:recombinase RecT n=1 Tax=Massilia sp. ZL223 TaxID=2824904 RepID=UPI001B83CD47|nr:RecT family recombinase [Massilia sp. ZL223]MBQ5963180.1 recombinase RecT [Massilia sp. ZL223]
MSNALAIVTGAIQEARDDFSRVLVDRSLSFERESGFAIQQLQKNDYTLGVAMKNKQSVINAVTNVAAIGISLNPARKQAYLVPRDGQICLDISYIGLLDLAVASGSILWGQAEIVRENDGFSLNGFDKPPTHNFNPFGKDRGPIIGAYVVVKTHSGDYLTTTMSIDEIYAIRDRSEGWKAFYAKKIKSTPWASDEGEMIKKTVIKRAYKLWPKTERLDDAMDHLNRTNAEGLSDRPDDWIDVAPLIAEALRTRTDVEALAYWKAHNAQLANQPADHKKLKDAIATHRAKLRAEAQEASTIDVEATPVTEQPAMTAEEADFQCTQGAPA